MRYKKNILRAIMLFVLTGLAPKNICAAEIEGVTFRDRFDANGTGLELCGTDLFRYPVVINAYAGTLYMPADVPSEDVLGDIPKRLGVEYFHAINGEDFG